MPESRRGFFARLGDALKKTRGALVGSIADLLRRSPNVDEALVEEVETILLGADVGLDATARIMGSLEKQLNGRGPADGESVLQCLQEEMLGILEPVAKPLRIPENLGRPFVILTVGVNGTGKTTTIGKLASRFRAQGRSVMLAAGDTFRAAAIEQLRAWGERCGCTVVAQHTGADSASVIYDAFEAARARGVDVLIADTAGRLHTQVGLMDELRKVKRVIGKLNQDAPDEVLLVLDAGTGQNALQQAIEFNEAVGLTGLAITKLDGTAKGGIVFAIAHRLGIPLRFIGVGEGIDDLREFDASEFVSALVDRTAA